MEESKPIDDAVEKDEELVLVEGKEEEQQEVAEQPKSADEEALRELNNKYLRLYAEFDNYKKRVNRDKEELARYGNESLLHAMLPAIDNLELALKHGTGDSKDGIVQGVEITLKELKRTLEKFGLTRIPAAGEKFDPAVHHAMTQVERDDMEEKMVAEELRTGYRYHDKVLRPSLVAVSVKTKTVAKPAAEGAEEEAGRTDTRTHKTHKDHRNIKEER